MQKKLSQFVRLLFALVVAFGVLVPIGANAQPPIDVPGIGPAIAEAKIAHPFDHWNRCSRFRRSLINGRHRNRCAGGEGSIEIGE